MEKEKSIVNLMRNRKKINKNIKQKKKYIKDTLNHGVYESRSGSNIELGRINEANCISNDQNASK